MTDETQVMRTLSGVLMANVSLVSALRHSTLDERTSLKPTTHQSYVKKNPCKSVVWGGVNFLY
jgi:hypothetical protein